MNLKGKHIIQYVAPLLSCLMSCSNSLPVQNEVVIYVSNDPEMLNPCNSIDATAGYITSYMFQRLIDADFKNPPETVPVLAQSRPVIEKTPEGKMTLTFKLRPEAKWDNGSPVTVRDVEFSIKAILNPLVNNPHAKPYFAFITDFIFYPDDSLKFTVVSNEIYFMAEATFTDIVIMPEYLYDPKGLLKKYTLKLIAAKSDSLKSDALLKEFADDFNSEKRMRDVNFIGGSGAYKFTEWKTNERVILTKKDNWWGDKLEKENCYFEAYPEKLIFQTIRDQTSAIVALKAGNLDVMHNIKSKDFSELPKSEKFTEKFNAYTPMQFSYVYIGLNTKSPLISDKETRQALAHIINVDEIINTVRYGQAERIIGPIHPTKKKVYNSSLVPYKYDPDEAKRILEKAGWKNSNGDETLDKIIQGKKTEFEIDFIVNTGNDERKAIALMFQEEAKKIGIKINVLILDWAVFLERCINHEFDLQIGKWVSSPYPDDLKQSFHSESAKDGGSNFSNFSNPETDALIDSIRYEIDEEKRNVMYMRAQEILHKELPMIFLYAPTEHIAISKKFDNAYPSVIRPGYYPPAFKLKESTPK